MALTLTTAAANSQIDNLTAQVNGGTVEFWTTGGPESGTKLGTLTLSATAFTAAASKSATLNTVTEDSSADATGSAAICVFKASGGTEIFRGTVTASGGGGDITMPSVSITSGEPIRITSGTLSHP